MSDVAVPARGAGPDQRALSQAELLEIAQRWASYVQGRPETNQPADRRWFSRLEMTEDYEVELIGWNHVQSTDFHNHGGSAGAVVVAAGALVESRVDPAEGAQVRQRLSIQGHSFSFGPDIIHNVTNADQGPSLSIHVYSPPLATMTFFDVDGTTTVERETTAVDGPEPGSEEIKFL